MMRARFTREAERASQLDHPNVARVVDFGQTAHGLLYIVMDYVEGPSLVALIGQALNQASPIAIGTAAWYPKAGATFSDVLAAVRRECWEFLDIRTSQSDPAYAEIPRSQLDRLLNAVCYSH